MTKLLIKILILVFIVTGVSVVLTQVVLPEFWPRGDVQAKLDWLREHPQEYNTVFIGPSHIYHQVIPTQFDSLAAAHGVQIHSFNMGVPSFPFPQSTRMTDLILKEIPNVKYVFYEITPVYYSPAEQLRHTPENYYWYDFRHTRLLSEYVDAKDSLESQAKTDLWKLHALSWVEKNLFAGGAQKLIGTFYDGKKEWTEYYCREGAGYSALDLEMWEGPYVNEIQERRANFLKDTSVLAVRRSEAWKFVRTERTCNPTVYSDYLEQMYNDFTAEGIQLYFVIAPRMTTYNDLSDLLCQLPKSAVIDLSSPDSSPEFYKADFVFDKGHLNHAGARIFTRKLFELSLGTARP